jgi:hypothetical protein
MTIAMIPITMINIEFEFKGEIVKRMFFCKYSVYKCQYLMVPIFRNYVHALNPDFLSV